MAGRIGRLPAGFRMIGGLVHFQNDTSDLELGAAKEQARRLREEKDDDGRTRYLGVAVVNKAPEKRDGGSVVRFGRVFVARREDNPNVGGDRG